MSVLSIAGFLTSDNVLFGFFVASEESTKTGVLQQLPAARQEVLTLGCQSVSVKQRMLLLGGAVDTFQVTKPRWRPCGNGIGASQYIGNWF